jgi:lysozyme family protein
MSFSKIFPFTMAWEGWSEKTNDPDDPGGLTKYGLSKKANPDLDIANLTLGEAEAIYKKRYWEPVAKYEDDALDMAAFDSCVNCGVPTVKLWLPQCNSFDDLLNKRMERYRYLIRIRPALAKYSKGWTNRVDALRKFLVNG